MQDARFYLLVWLDRFNFEKLLWSADSLAHAESLTYRGLYYKLKTLQRKRRSRADPDTLSLGENLSRMRTRTNTL